MDGVSKRSLLFSCPRLLEGKRAAFLGRLVAGQKKIELIFNGEFGV